MGLLDSIEQSSKVTKESQSSDSNMFLLGDLYNEQKVYCHFKKDKEEKRTSNERNSKAMHTYEKL